MRVSSRRSNASSSSVSKTVAWSSAPSASRVFHRVSRRRRKKPPRAGSSAGSSGGAGSAVRKSSLQLRATRRQLMKRRRPPRGVAVASDAPHLPARGRKPLAGVYVRDLDPLDVDVSVALLERLVGRALLLRVLDLAHHAHLVAGLGRLGGLVSGEPHPEAVLVGRRGVGHLVALGDARAPRVLVGAG